MSQKPENPPTAARLRSGAAEAEGALGASRGRSQRSPVGDAGQGSGQPREPGSQEVTEDRPLSERALIGSSNSAQQRGPAESGYAVSELPRSNRPPSSRPPSSRAKSERGTVATKSTEPGEESESVVIRRSRRIDAKVVAAKAYLNGLPTGDRRARLVHAAILRRDETLLDAILSGETSSR